MSSKFVVWGAIAVSVMSTVIVACDDDDTKATPTNVTDGGNEASADATTDGATADAATDGSVTTDGGTDAATDAATDAPADAANSG